MSNKDFAKYEQSRLAYFESKAVVETAKVENTFEIIQNCIQKGYSIEEIAGIVMKSVEYVKDAVQKLGLSNGKN
jgi:hypothetical protein